MSRHWCLSRHFRHVRNRLREITIAGSDIACALAGPRRRKAASTDIEAIRRRLGILRGHRRSRAVQPLPAAATWKAHLRYMVVFRFGQKLRGPGHRRGDVRSGSATQPDLRPPRQRDPHRVRNRLGDHRSTLAPVQRQARRPGWQGWLLLRGFRTCRRCELVVRGTRFPAMGAGLSFRQARALVGRAQACRCMRGIPHIAKAASGDMLLLPVRSFSSAGLSPPYSAVASQGASLLNRQAQDPPCIGDSTALRVMQAIDPPPGVAESACYRARTLHIRTTGATS
jgi:hypothetical protein